MVRTRRTGGTGPTGTRATGTLARGCHGGTLDGTTVAVAGTRHALRRRERVVAGTWAAAGAVGAGTLALAGHALRGGERVVAGACGRGGLTRSGTDGCTGCGCRRGSGSRSGGGRRGGRGRARGSGSRGSGRCDGGRRGARGLDDGCGGRRGGRRAGRCLRCCCCGRVRAGATGGVLVAQLADDRGLDGRRCRPHELSEVVQLGHDGLAVDPELFGELVDADLGHISPVSVRPDRVGPSLVFGTHRWVLIGTCSSGSHRLPDPLPSSTIGFTTPGSARCRPRRYLLELHPRRAGARRSRRAGLRCAVPARVHVGVRRSRGSLDRGAATPPCPASSDRRPRPTREIPRRPGRRPLSAELTSGRWLGTPRTSGSDPCLRQRALSVGSAGSTGGAGHPAQPQEVYRAGPRDASLDPGGGALTHRCRPPADRPTPRRPSGCRCASR